MFGKLVAAFIYIGLFYGLMIFIVTSTLLIFFIVNVTLDIEDKIKAKRALK